MPRNQNPLYRSKAPCAESCAIPQVTIEVTICFTARCARRLGKPSKCKDGRVVTNPGRLYFSVLGVRAISCSAFPFMFVKKLTFKNRCTCHNPGGVFFSEQHVTTLPSLHFEGFPHEAPPAASPCGPSWGAAGGASWSAAGGAS